MPVAVRRYQVVLPASNSQGAPPESGPPLAIVINSGRCGSTALSAALRLHPRVLSLSEFFRCLGPGALVPGRYNAEHFWRALAQPRAHMTAMLRYRVEPPEILYPVD